MESALERTLVIFKQMSGQDEISEDLRDGAEQHIKKLFDSGETDEQRLTVRTYVFEKGQRDRCLINWVSMKPRLRRRGCFCIFHCGNKA